MRGHFLNKLRMERMSTLTDAPQDDEQDAHQQLTPEQQEQWKEISLGENIKQGSHALLLWTAFQIASRSCVYLNSPECYLSQQSTTTLVMTRVLEYSFLIMSSVPLYLCLSEPRAIMYLPVVCLHFVYLLVMNLPPYTYSCDELLDLQMCDTETSDYRDLIADHRDCTLQGHTAQQMCMTWLLITPRIIPRLWMMNLPWLWIFFFYFGTSIWYITRHVDEKATSVADVQGQVFGSRYFSDVDIVCSIVLLCVTQGIAVSKKFYLEKSQKNKYVYDVKLQEASEKMFEILHYMVPLHVIPRMLLQKSVADPVEKVSILFIMICDFDQFTRKYSPEKLLEFLNAQFTAMDHICQEYEVTKIETVGEEYVAAVGVIPKDIEASKSGHGVILMRLIKAALDIMSLEPTGQDEVHFKMGIHTGPIVAGVIGQKLPRFRLFGDTINTSARMMQKGLPDEVQFGVETKNELDKMPDAVKVRSRGTVEMKGKGKIEAFLVDRSDHFKKNQSEKAKGGVRFDDDGVGSARQSTASSFNTKRQTRKSLVSTLITNHSLAHEEAEKLDVQTMAEKRKKMMENYERGSIASSTGNRHGSLATSRSSLMKQEVEMSAVASRGNTVSDNVMRTPLLEPLEETSFQSRDNSAFKSFDPRVAAHETQEAMAKKSSNTSLEAMRPVRSVKSFAGRQRHTRINRLETTLEEQENVEEKKAKKKQFEWVLDQMEKLRKADKELEDSKKTDGVVVGRLAGILNYKVDTEGFTKEMEQGWMQWYHEMSICKKLAPRLDKQALFLSILTCFDTIYMVATRTPREEHSLYDPTYRFPIFLAARSLVFLIVMAWRVVAGSSDHEDKTWVETSPNQVQSRILGSYCAIAALMFISYDAMTVETQLLKARAARESSIFSLVFVIMYFIVITNFQLLFRPTCWFIALSCALMAVNMWQSFRSLFFSHLGKALFILNSVMNAYLAKEAEQTSRARFKAQHAMKNTCDRIENILNTLMPPLVVQEIRGKPKEAPPSHKYKRATIAQSDLCGFTKLAATRKPEEVVEFMDQLFGLFDALTDKYAIYKVETIGDAYIAGQADWPLTSKNKPISVILFGLDMVKSVHEWSRGMGENVSCRVGIHTGECIGGIVGTEMQRYHLFGDLMTCLEILESTAPEGRVQISPSCKDACEDQMRRDSLPKEIMTFDARPESQLKTSKGETHEYDEVGGRTFVVKSYAQLRGMLSSEF